MWWDHPDNLVNPVTTSQSVLSHPSHTFSLGTDEVPDNPRTHVCTSQIHADTHIYEHTQTQFLISLYHSTLCYVSGAWTDQMLIVHESISQGLRKTWRGGTSTKTDPVGSKFVLIFYIFTASECMFAPNSYPDKKEYLSSNTKAILIFWTNGSAFFLSFLGLSSCLMLRKL